MLVRAYEAEQTATRVNVPDLTLNNADDKKNIFLSKQSQIQAGGTVIDITGKQLILV